MILILGLDVGRGHGRQGVDKNGIVFGCWLYEISFLFGAVGKVEILSMSIGVAIFHG